MHRFLVTAAATALCGSTASAEVKSVSPTHFESENKAVVAADPAATYAALGRIGEWWNKGHTYSGDASNLSLDLKAGGCFCERVPADGGTVDHMRVLQARPGSTLRLQGGLGPLQGEAVTGTLTWSLKPVSGGTEVTQTYIVSGHIRGGAEQLAPAVDRVLSEQLAGLKRRLSAKP
jgi:uncharacterized protein YndB with AHSA1/START domain